MRFSHTRRGNSPGQVEVRVLGVTTLGGARGLLEPVQVRHHQYTWKAPRDLPGALPSDRSVRFDVYIDADDVRRFRPVPADGLDGYVERAFQYGHSFLARDRGFDWATWCAYLVDKLAFDRLNRAQQRMRRMFKSAGDLSIRKSIRGLTGENDILPSDLGLSASSEGYCWSVDKLLSVGRETARVNGLTNPTTSESISYGLVEAARLNPLRVADGEAKALIRMALFDFSRSGPRVSDTDRDDVRQRLHGLIREHINDERHLFKRWLAGGHSNLPKAIANRGGISARKLNRDVVNRSLLELGWDGYFSVAECLEAFARAFSRALARPLSPREQTYFQAMYHRQPYLGGLPLVLVMDRRAQIQPLISELWEQPGDIQLIGALHQVLRYYAEMTASRRQADRLAKQPRIEANEFHQDIVVEGDLAMLGEVFRELIERRRIHCRQCTRTAEGSLSEDGFQEGHSFRVDVVCLDHGLIDSIVVSWQELLATRSLFASATE